MISLSVPMIDFLLDFNPFKIKLNKYLNLSKNTTMILYAVRCYNKCEE